MDNRGNYRDSDRDGSNNRRSGGDRDERDQRRDPSSSSSQQHRIEEEETTHYRSQIAPRPTNITTNRVVPSSNNIIMERFYSYGTGPGVPLKPGGKSAAVVAIQENREREKRELSHLNDRFASYIERVRYLEALNKKLQLELEHLRGKWGSETGKVKEMYEVEIREARRIIDETSKDRATAELRAKRAEEETLKYKDKYETLLAGRDTDRQKIEALQKQLADNEADLNLFRRRIADLEDEQKRFRAESQKLILDIQRVTQDLDQETIARVQLENEKQSLEEEINFLKQIHAQEIEELKHANLIGTALDPSNFFKHELSNAIRDIREEYEQLNNQQRNELESWYRIKVTQAVQEVQARRAIEGPESVREREEIKKLRTLVTDSRKDISAMRQRNGELENRIQELEELVQIERREGIQASNERDREIQELRARLEELGRDYDELVTTKSSLDAEIAIYRKLLEGEENRAGLKQIVSNVEEQARADFAAAGGAGGGSGGGASSGGAGGAAGSGGTSSYSYSRSYRTTSGGQGNDSEGVSRSTFSSASCAPTLSVPSAQIETTIFDQVYGGYRRRPAMISLNFQWIPTNDRSGTYQWNEYNGSGSHYARKVKTVTFFGTGEMRGQQQSSKPVTPPSSDYTDAYLSTFASKPIPARHVQRLSTSVFTNSTPVPLKPTSTPIFTSSLPKTSETRLNTMTSSQVSTASDKPTVFPSTGSFTYSSSFIPEKSTTCEPFSSTQYSSPKSQTYTSSYSTSLHSSTLPTTTAYTNLSSSTVDSQPSYRTLPSHPQPSTTTFPNFNRFETVYENVYKPMAPYSIQSYPPSNIHTTLFAAPSKAWPSTPSEPFQSSSSTINQPATTERIISPTPKVEKSISRPETLLFQPDEELQSSLIAQPSPIVNPSPETPVSGVISKVERESAATNELISAASAPIQILENTLNKYDSLINQISEVLASVSPLSSTISSMSPGKSVLDYPLSSDDSPTVPNQRLETQLSQSARTNVISQTEKSSHLIREESYDKIVTAISDLDTEISSQLDAHKLSTSTDEEKQTPSDDKQVPSSAEVPPEEAQTVSEVSQPMSTTKESENEEQQSSPSTELPSLVQTEEKVAETEDSLIDQSEVQSTSDQPLSSTIPKDEEDSQDLQTTSTQEEQHEGTTIVSAEKEILAGEQTQTEVPSTEAKIEETESAPAPLAEQLLQVVQSDISTSEIQQIDLLASAPEDTSVIDAAEQTFDDDTSVRKFAKRVTWDEAVVDNGDEENSLTQSLTEENSTPEPTMITVVGDQSTTADQPSLESPTDLPLNTSEQVCSPSPTNTQSPSTDDSSKEDTFTINEVSQSESTDSSDKRQMKTFEQIPENVPSQFDELITEETTSISQSVTLSPIDTLADAISNRFISSDVYHGCQGDHHQYSSDKSSAIESDSTTESLFTSLRDSISIPITPLIETIQSVVSSMHTTTAVQSLKLESETKDTILENTAPIAEGNSTENNPSTMLESIQDTITESLSSQSIENPLEKGSNSVEGVEIPNLTSNDAKKSDELHITVDSASNEIDIRQTQSDVSSVLIEEANERKEDQEPVPITTEFSSSPTVDNASAIQVHADDAESSTADATPITSLSDASALEPTSSVPPLAEVLSSDQTTGHLPLPDDKDDEESSLTTVTEPTAASHDDVSEQTYDSDKQEVAQAETTSTTIDSAYTDTSVETKTTLEVIRDAITHPLATLTEKLHEIMPETDDLKEQNVSSTEMNTNTDELQSTDTKTTLETIRDAVTHPISTLTETIQSIVSTSASEQNENVAEDAAVDEQHIEISDSKSTLETLRDVITHPITTITETFQSVISSSTAEAVSDFEQQISTSDNKDQDITTTAEAQEEESILQTKQDTITDLSTSTEDRITDQVDADTNQILIDTIQDLINETIESVINDLDQATSVSNMTWSDLVDEKSVEDTLHQSFESIPQSPDEVVQPSNHTMDSETPTEPNQPPSTVENLTEQTIITPSNDEHIAQQFDAVKTTVTEIDKEPSSDVRETSPANTEDDPADLIDALQGHSIIIPSATSMNEQHEEQLPTAQEKSSSSGTTSSQITSSDRYVSYAIHEMGDSSQERLPSFPVAADIPVYEADKKISDESKDQRVLSEQISNNNQGPAKDDDLTELDATENLTSYSDDAHKHKHHALQSSNQQQKSDASSTDEDVDDENFSELEQSDISNLYRIIDEITRPGKHESTYRRYDLSNSSSVSTKPQTDDIYIIPGYPGLWKPSADDDESIHSGCTNDADDEDEKHQSASAIKTKTTVRTTNPTQLQVSVQQRLKTTSPDPSSQSETVDVFNRPLNEFSFDVSESDSFKTCASTINSSSVSKQTKTSDLYQVPISEQQEHQTSPDEKILLIRERERGVSLPVTMKIDYDDMALRLSTSTPIDAPLYPPSAQADLPSALGEPMLKTTSSSRASTPSLSSNESEQQKLPSSTSTSWLNTINTITTTIQGPDGPLEARTTIHKSAKGPISVAECEPQGKYIIVENTSRSKNIALSGWTLQQENDNGELLTYSFPENCLLRSNQSIKILSKSNETERRNGDLIASLLSSWHTSSNVVTKLINADGKDRASLTRKTLFS